MKKYIFYFTAFTLFYFVACEMKSHDSSSAGKSVAVNENGKGLSSEPKFYFIYTVEKSMGILEEYRAEIPMTLLEKEKSRVCAARTGKILKEHSEYLDATIAFTEILTKENCGHMLDYSLGIMQQKIENYDIVPFKIVENENLAQKLDRKVRATDGLQKLLLRNGGVKYEVGELVSDKLPVVYQYGIPGFSVYIVQYEFKMIPGVIGPRVVVIGDSAHPLTGQCSYPYLRGFKLNSAYYIESGSGCCECGITGKEVFKVTSKGIELVYKDYRLSG